MSSRLATHAGSWYSSNVSTLDAQLSKFLANAHPTQKGARVLVGPHAGYAYCGSVLAETYKAWDTSKVKTVFIFSPSHYVYFKGARVSSYDTYETPLGNIPVNTGIVKELLEEHPKDFKYMNHGTDDKEHGLEMHMPLLYKVTKDLPQGVPRIVPILISASDENFEKRIGAIMAKYLDDEENSFIVSSDFCHWGSRFDYTVYTADETVETFEELSYGTNAKKLPVPIHKSIEYLDKAAMARAAAGSYKLWRDYIKKTGNTICGQKPLAIMLHALELYKQEHKIDSNLGFNWTAYTQSNAAKSVDDSSVSYASGHVVV